MKKINFLLAVAITGIALVACNGSEKKTTEEQKLSMQVKEDTVLYKLDSVSMIGYVAWDASTDNKRPVILVVPEWWGLNDYTKSRVKQLAELGYLAFGVDMYGNGLQADNPKLAGELATPFYKDPAMAKARFDAALSKALSYPQADSTRTGAIGYCFGGTQVLNAAFLGSPLRGIVSFHGSLQTVPVKRELLKAQILVCNGEADTFVPADEVKAFRSQLDSAKVPYIFKNYAGATHAFTNPAATETGKKFDMPIAYNAAADTASWKEMKSFFERIF